MVIASNRNFYAIYLLYIVTSAPAAARRLEGGRQSNGTAKEGRAPVAGKVEFYSRVFRIIAADDFSPPKVVQYW